MGGKSLHLRLHRGIGLIGRRECGSVLCGCGRALVFVNLEARHNLIENSVVVVEAEFTDGASCSSEFKVRFTEIVLEFDPRLVCVVCMFPRADVIFEDPLFVQDDEGKVDCLDLG